MNPKQMLALLLGMGTFSSSPELLVQNGAFGGSRRQSKKLRFGLPFGYPGAKMARKAAMGRVSLKHLGIRADHAPSR